MPYIAVYCDILSNNTGYPRFLNNVVRNFSLKILTTLASRFIGEDQ